MTEPRTFRNLAATQADEDAYDTRKIRGANPDIKFTSTVGSIAHIVKGALGGGILVGHVGYMKGGVLVAIPLNIFFGVYMGYCLYLLVQSTQLIYKRTKMPTLSYADVGEAALMLSPNKSLRALAKPFRYSIDALVCMDLLGACCCYQIIIAKSIKQLVENTHETTFDGAYEGYPSLRIYLAIMMPFVILICLIRHLKILAPFSIGANLVIVVCIFLTVHYAFENNPGFENLTMTTNLYGTFEYVGMSVFGMSCCSIVISIEAHMDKPKEFNIALTVGMGLIILFLFCISFFGYVAYLEECVSPVTLNFPMTFMSKLLKGGIAAMIYVTHALNFWVPFNLIFHYIKKKHAPNRLVFVEYIYRALLVVLLTTIAIIFPDINSIMGFIGSFSIANMAFVYPNCITLLVVWHRPGLGAMKWRLWRGVVLLIIGLFVFFCGSLVNAMEMVSVFIKVNINQEEMDTPDGGGGGGGGGSGD